MEILEAPSTKNVLLYRRGTLNSNYFYTIIQMDSELIQGLVTEVRTSTSLPTSGYATLTTNTTPRRIKIKIDNPVYDSERYKATVTLDNNKISNTVYSTWLGGGFRILGYSSTNSIKGRIYSVKQFKESDDGLASNFIPAKDLGGKVGMYIFDYISSSGTKFEEADTAFIAGPEI